MVLLGGSLWWFIGPLGGGLWWFIGPLGGGS